MQNKTQVLFVYSISEAKFAIDFYYNNNNNVKIIVASISSMLELNKANVPYVNINDLLYKNKKNYYLTDIVPIYKKTDKFLQIIRSKINIFQINQVNLIDLLQIFITAELLEVFYSYYLFSKIEKKWHPYRYYFNSNLKTQNTGWHTDYFSTAAIIADYFCSKTKRKYYQINSSNNQNYFIKYLLKLIKSPKRLFIIIIIYFIRIFENVIPKKYNIKNIDFLIFSNGFNLYYYHPLFRLLKNKYKYLKYYIASTWQVAEDEWLLRKNNINFNNINIFNNKYIKYKVIVESKKIQKLTNVFFTKTENQDQIFSKSVSREIKNAIFYKLNIILNKYSTKFINQIYIADEVIHKTSPKLVITSYDPGPSALSFTLLAKNKNIPSLVLQHGLYNIIHNSNFQSKYIAVWGKYFKNEIAKYQKRNKSNILITGLSFLDKYYKNYIKKYKYTIQEDRPIKLGLLLTLYQCDPFVINNFFIDLIEVIKKSKIDIVLYIRPHPSQYIDDIEKLIKHFGIKCLYSELINLEQFIKQCDVIYSWDTTAIVWAMIYKKPLFYSSPWWGEGYLPIKKYNAAWMPKNADDFIIKLLEFVKNPEKIKLIQSGQQKFIKDVVGDIDGMSSLNTIKTIKALLSK